MNWFDRMLAYSVDTVLRVLLPIALFAYGLRWAFSYITSDDIASVFETTLLFTGMCVGLWWLFDKTFLRTIDTIQELKNGNVAYAVALLALAVVILSGALVGS